MSVELTPARDLPRSALLREDAKEHARMLALIIVAVLAITAVSTFRLVSVVVNSTDPQHRKDAIRLCAYTLSGGGTVTALLQLHSSGLLVQLLQ